MFLKSFYSHNNMPSGIYLRTKKHIEICIKNLDNEHRSQEIKKKCCETLRPHRIGEYNHSKETKEKIRIKHLGKSLSKEHRLKIGLGNLGRKQSQYSRLKMSLSKKGKTGEEIYGKEQHEKIRENLRIKNIGRKLSEKTKEKIRNVRARQIFPIKNTSIEIKICKFLEELKIDFMKQHFIDIKHSYLCDIFIPSMNLVIECDGDYFHGNIDNPRFLVLNKIQLEQIEEDKIRTIEMKEKGYKVLRLWECKIRKMNLDEFREILDKQKDILYNINL